MELAGWGLTVLGVTGPELVRSRLPFTFEATDGERAVEFRQRYRLDEAVAAGTTELEQLMLLRDWVADKVPFGKPEDADIDPFHILDRAAAGAKHNCTYLSVVYLAALESLGHTARKLSTCGHGTIEMWCNGLAKWVVLDPSRRNCYTLNGEILSAQDVREQYLTDGGVSMEVLYGLNERSEQVTLAKREDGHLKYRQEAYEWTAYHVRNNFLGKLVDFAKDRFYIYRDDFNRGKPWLAASGEVDQRYKLATLTDRLADIYWSVNVTRVHLAPRMARSLTVQLETMTPNFDTFLVKKDGVWKPTRPQFTWHLKRGPNTLKVRARNAMGVLGPVATVTIELSRTTRV